MYIVVSNVASVNFIIGLGTFDLLTIGLAAQRSIRNEVICMTALSYNNYTFALLQDVLSTHVEEKNDQSCDVTLDELTRVDEYNEYFCTTLTEMHSMIDYALIFDSDDDLTTQSLSYNSYCPGDFNQVNDIQENNVECDDTVCYLRINFLSELTFCGRAD